MLYKKLFVPFDGTPHAQDAMKLAAAMVADDPAAEIVFFRVLAGITDAAMEEAGLLEQYREARQQERDELEATIRATIDELIPDAPNPITVSVEHAPSPVDGILAKAEEIGADAIVMGVRGKNPTEGVVGSACFGVIRSARIPVTVVK